MPNPKTMKAKPMIIPMKPIASTIRSTRSFLRR